jgi:hypothetical protein
MTRVVWVSLLVLVASIGLGSSWAFSFSWATEIPWVFQDLPVIGRCQYGHRVVLAMQGVVDMALSYWMRPFKCGILVSHVMHAHNLDVRRVTTAAFIDYIYSCREHVMWGMVYQALGSFRSCYQDFDAVGCSV